MEWEAVDRDEGTVLETFEGSYNEAAAYFAYVLHGYTYSIREALLVAA